MRQKMRHQLIYLVLALTLVVGLAGLAVRGAQAQDPTIPTRTPTPGAPPPNPTATDDNQPNPPAPTDTPAPGTTATTVATATAAGIVAGSATPAGTANSLTTTPDTRQAGTCDDSPFATAVGVVYVYEGPGGDYNINATLQDGDTRRIVGRAGYADWWVIMLTPTETGWVDDQDVTVSGNPGLAPVVDPPPIGGATPTRGAPWNPTPPPFPTCPATATATPTATPTATASATTSAPATTSATAASSAAESAAATTAAAEPPTEVAPGTGLDSRGAESARTASPTSTMNLILPLGGLALIAGGIVIALIARNRGAKKPDEPQPK